MLILAIIVIGMFSGWLAHLVLERNRRTNWGRLFAFGIAGSFVGGTLASLIAGDGFQLRLSGIIGSFIGALIIMSIANRVTA